MTLVFKQTRINHAIEFYVNVGGVITRAMSLSATGFGGFDKGMDLKEVLEPATPPSGYVRLFTKSDKKPYYKDDTGAVFPFGTGGGAGLFSKEIVTLTGTDISNKYIVLDSAPASRINVELNIEGGPEQVYGYDFEITDDDGGKRLSWSGLTLDGQLSSGDVLLIYYETAV